MDWQQYWLCCRCQRYFVIVSPLDLTFETHACLPWPEQDSACPGWCVFWSECVFWQCPKIVGARGAILVIAASRLLHLLKLYSSQTHIQVTLNVVEIYCERIRCLLSGGAPGKDNLQVGGQMCPTCPAEELRLLSNWSTWTTDSVLVMQPWSSLPDCPYTCCWTAPPAFGCCVNVFTFCVKLCNAAVTNCPSCACAHIQACKHAKALWQY